MTEHKHMENLVKANITVADYLKLIGSTVAACAGVISFLFIYIIEPSLSRIEETLKTSIAVERATRVESEKSLKVLLDVKFQHLNSKLSALEVKVDDIDHNGSARWRYAQPPISRGLDKKQ